MVRTSPFHGGNRGSNPLGVTRASVEISKLFILIESRSTAVIEGSSKGMPSAESPWGHQSFGRNIEAFLF